MQDIKTAMQARLETAGIGFEKIQVFGAIRCNVHVTCKSRDTAEKWAALLAGVFKGAKVACVPTVWKAAGIAGAQQHPVMHKGFLVAVAA